MKNSIIWQGISSSTIDGLLISELPPITKPAMRTRTTTIDGRDGDIVEELGYESYSKKIKIGLHGNYDIDQIMKYFSNFAVNNTAEEELLNPTKGIVVFSNEPDKYYKATIVGKIDYNRLIRYRTAVVEFHVQPFKYKLNEEPIIGEITGTETTSITVRTAGTEISKPYLSIVGSGEITIQKNGHDIFTLNLEETVEQLIVDTEALEVTDDNGNLKNRKMSGEFLTLDPNADNVITWTGNLIGIGIVPRSRWL